MLVVSTRDFRANQSKYLNLANDGEQIILKSRSGSYKITPITSDDTIVENRDVVAELRDALLEVKAAIAENKRLQSLDELIDEL